MAKLSKNRSGSPGGRKKGIRPDTPGVGTYLQEQPYQAPTSRLQAIWDVWGGKKKPEKAPEFDGATAAFTGAGQSPPKIDDGLGDLSGELDPQLHTFMETVKANPEWIGFEGQQQATREHIQTEQTKQLGYAPGYYENPAHVARLYQSIQNAPADAVLPDWLDRDQVEIAYKWFEHQNEGKPWTEWEYLATNDPARSFLNGMGTPPIDFLNPELAERYSNPAEVMSGRMRWGSLPPDVRAGIMSAPNFYRDGISQYPLEARHEIMADPSFDWDQLPDWQKFAYDITSNPKLMASPMALAGAQAGKIAGLPGMVAGAAAGYGLGLVGGQEYDPTKGILEQPTFAAGMMRVLNALSEETEQGIGFASQLIQSGDIDILLDKTERSAAWEAGRITYGFSNFGQENWLPALFGHVDAPEGDSYFEKVGNYLKDRSAAEILLPQFATIGYIVDRIKDGDTVYAGPGQGFILGQNEPVSRDIGLREVVGHEVDTELAGAALEAGRAWMVKELEAGGDVDMLAMQLIQAEGTTVGGMVSDLALQSIADPLNVTPEVITKVTGGVAEVRGHVVAAEAASVARSPMEMMQVYKAKIQAGNVPGDFNYKDMGAISRFFGGVTEEGPVRAGAFSKESLLSPPEVHSPLDQGPKKLGQFMATLDPKARLLEGHHMAQNHLMQMFSRFDDIHELKAFYDHVKNGDMELAKEMAGRMADSPEWYTVLPAMKQFDGIDKIISAWDASEVSRMSLMDIARVLDDDPAALLSDLKRADGPARTLERLKKLADGNAEVAKLLERGLSTEDLTHIQKLFTGDNPVPWHPDQAKAVISSSLEKHFADWGVKYFDLKKDSITFRLADVGKKFQSALMLGGSSSYAINNQLSNMVFRAATGNFGYMSGRAIDQFFSDFGYTPHDAGRGVGAMGNVIEGTGELSQAIAGKLSGQGSIAKTGRVFGAVNKFMPFGALSRWFEGLERGQALAISMKKMWPRLWERGKGFRTMDMGLRNRMEKILPGSSDTVYRMIEAGMNPQQIENAIYGRSQVRQARGLVENAAKSTGMSRADATAMLEQIGVFEALDQYLPGADTPEKMRAVFRHVERVAQDNFDLRNAQELRARSEVVGERIKVEGPMAAEDVFIDNELMRTDRHLDHYMRAGETAQAVADAPWEMKGQLWNDFYYLSGREIRRTNAAYLANMQGIIDGLSLTDSPAARELISIMADEFTEWDGAYKFMREARNDHADLYSRSDDLKAVAERNQAYTDMDQAIDARFEQAFQKEAEVLQRIGEIYTDEFTKIFGDEAGAVVADRWGKIEQFRKDMRSRLQTFRESVKYITDPDQVRAAKAEFYKKEYMPMIVEMGNLRTDLGHSAQQASMGQIPPGGDRPPTDPADTGGAGVGIVDPADTASGTGRTPEQVQEFAQVAPDVVQDVVPDIVSPEEINVWDIARQAEDPVHGVDAEGIPVADAKIHMIRIAKKYGGTDGRMVKRFADISPEMAERMFAVRDQAKKQQAQLIYDRPAFSPEWQAAVEEAIELGIVPDEMIDQIRNVPAEKRTLSENQAFVHDAEVVPPVYDQEGNLVAAEVIYPQEAHRTKIYDDIGGKSFDDFVQYRKPLEAPMRDAFSELLRVAEDTGEKPLGVLQFIKKQGGINVDYRAGLAGGEKTLPGLFRKPGEGGLVGIGLDEMVVRLEEGGYLTQTDIDSPMDNGGVNHATELIRKALAGDEIFPLDTRVHPEWFKQAGGKDAAIRALKQIMAGAEDTALKRVQGIKELAWESMLDHADEYPDARAYLQLDYDQSGRVVNEITELGNRIQAMTDARQYNVDEMSAAANDLYRLFGKLPEDAPLEYMHRLNVLDEQIEVFEKDYQQHQKVVEFRAETKRAMVAEENRAEMLMTREILREKFVEAFEVPQAEADAAISLMDARAETWAKQNGRTPEEWYQSHVADVVRGGEGDFLPQLPDIAATKVEIEKYARRFAWANVDEMRKAVLAEDLILSFSDAIHKLSPDLEEGVATQVRDILLRDALNDNLSKGPNAAVEILEDGRAIIHAFEGGNVSSIVHEAGHLFRRDLDGADLKIAEEWAGVTPLEEGGAGAGEWTTTAEEKFARGFEAYLADGNAPTPQLQRVFFKFKQWLVDIYQKLKGSPIDVKITDDMRSVFDRLISSESDWDAYSPNNRTRTELRAYGDMAGQDGVVAGQLEPGGHGEFVYAEAGKPVGLVRYSNEGITSMHVLRDVSDRARVAGDLLAATGRATDANVMGLWEQVGQLAKDQQGEQLFQIAIDGVEVQKAADLFDLDAIKQQAQEFRERGNDRRGEVREGVDRRETYSLTDDNILFQNTDPRMPFGAYEEAVGFIPEGYAMDEGWSQMVKPLIDGMQEEGIRQLGEKKFQAADLDPATQKDLRTYVNQVKADMSTAKQATVKYGEEMTNFALLNYDRRVGADKMLETGVPYQLFYTRTLINSAMRGVFEKPAWFSNYARLQQMSNKHENNLPERLRDKIKIPAPFLPEWMGDSMYVDPNRTLFPWESYTAPFENVTKNKNYQMIQAERVLQEWTQDGTYSQGEVENAWRAQEGPLWEKAMAEALVRRGGEKDTPFDLMATMLGPAYYLKNPWYDVTGGAGQYSADSQLPITRTANAFNEVTNNTWMEPVGDFIGLFGKPEGALRQITGLGEYGDKDLSVYYVKRQLANLVADGEIGIQDAQIAMAEQAGPAWDAANERVRMELAMRTPLAAATYAGLNEGAGAGLAALPASLFSSGLLPDGELKYRGLKEKWDAAWDERDRGNTEAITQFFDDHPEYEVYLAKNKSPEDQLRGYLVGAIWDGYMSFDKVNRKVVTGQLGPEFRRSFLDKTTRSYETLDVATLAGWARMVGGQVPTTEATATITEIPDAQFPQPEGVPLDISVSVTGYETWKAQNYPNINAIQGMYFDSPIDERRKIAQMYPELTQYWREKRAYLDAHPEAAQFIDKRYSEGILSGEREPIGMDQAQAQRLLMDYRPSDYDIPVRTAEYYLQDATPFLREQILGYALIKDPLGAGSLAELREIWETNEKPGGSLEDFIDKVIIPTFVYQ